VPESVYQLLVTYGPLGLIVLMLIFPFPGKKHPVLTPWWYLEKQDEETEALKRALEIEREVSKRAVSELELTNRLVGEMKQIAASRPRKGSPDEPHH
jgi:hypothetical protein